MPVGNRLKNLQWPSATIALIVCNCLMFIAQQFLAGRFQYQLMLRPHELEPVSWLTSMFMHGDGLHLAANMVFLWIFGVYLETRLGWLRLLVLYLASGVAAAGVFLAVHWGGQTAMLGASGAIAGLMGLCVAAAPLGKLTLLPLNPAWLAVAMMRERRLTFVMPLVAWVGLWLFTQVAWAWAGVQGIAFAAHFGGIAAGLMIGLAMRAKETPELVNVGPAAEDEVRAIKRERMVVTVAAAWAGKTRTDKPPVDYLQPRAPNWDDKPKPRPPVTPHEVWDREAD
jgi:membrane associated rhomboid family serine protease